MENLSIVCSDPGRECVFADELGALQEDVEQFTTATCKRLSILHSLATACGVVPSPLSPSKQAARINEVHSSPNRTPSAHHRRPTSSNAEECAPSIEPLFIYRLRGLMPPTPSALASSRKRVHPSGATCADEHDAHSATALKRSRSTQNSSDTRPSGKFVPRKTAGNAATQPAATNLIGAEQTFDRCVALANREINFEFELFCEFASNN